MCAASFQPQNHTAVKLNCCMSLLRHIHAGDQHTPVGSRQGHSARGLGSERAGLALPGTDTQAVHRHPC
jgi:hypothetical protein